MSSYPVCRFFCRVFCVFVVGIVGGVGEQSMGMINSDDPHFADMTLLEMHDRNETENTF